MPQAHLVQVGLRHIHFHHQGVEVGHGHHRGPGVGRSAEGGHHFPHLGVFRGHHPVEGAADVGVFQGRLGIGQPGPGHLDAGLGRGHPGPAFGVPGHGGIEVLLGNEVLAHQGLIALILETGVRPLCLGGAQIGFGLLHLGDGLVPGGDQILILQGGQNLALFDPAAFLHPEVDQAAGALGGHRGLALGHHVAAGV